jgi:anti-sigma factor RsiW
MNDSMSAGHCSEEQIIALLLNDADPEIRAHVDSCPTCTKALAEYREVRRRVELVREEEVPPLLEARIMRLARHGRRDDRGAGLPGVVHALLTNPLFMVVAVVAMLIVLYLLVGSELVNVP